MPGVFFRPPGQAVTTPGDYQASPSNPQGNARPNPFAPGHDINFQVSSATEGYKRLLSMTVPYYKIISKQSQVNIYGESLNKIYYEPVMIKCYIDRGDEVISIGEYGPTNTQISKFWFVHEVMVQVQVLPEVGDIILDRERYYEINNINENHIMFGNDDQYYYNANNFTETPLFKRGESLMFELDTHMTTITRLNLLPYKVQ
jgi:hypothetical protein